jgi:hypothetical protein
VAAAWLALVIQLRPAYLEAYRQMIGSRPGDVAGAAPDPRARERALRLLSQLDTHPRNRTRILRAITRLHRSSPTLGLDASSIAEHVEREARTVDHLRRVAEAGLTDGQTGRFLKKQVDARLAQALERISRLLALVYPPQDIVAAHRVLRSGPLRVRAGALELLETLVDMDGKLELVESLEAQALGISPPVPPSPAEGLLALLALDDAWMRARAVWSAAELGLLRDEVERRAGSDPSRRVRLLARLVLRRRTWGAAVAVSPPAQPSNEPETAVVPS